MSHSALIIDDNPSIRELLTEALQENGYVAAAAPDAKTGLSMIPNWKPDVVLLDIQMPGMNGLTALARIMGYDKHAAVIMITSVDELESVRKSLKTGAYDYLIKPIDLPVVLETMERAIERIENTYNETILALGSALETRDVETQEHSLRVARYTLEIIRRMGVLDNDRLRDVKRGAFLHDIGKIGVPDQILLKPGPLSPDEWKIMREHPAIGVRMLDGIRFLTSALPIVRSHHERWDGGGYPDGLSGEEIPIEARAFAVADALDAITSDRPYREGKPLIDARRIIANAAGGQFDPGAAAALAEIADEEIELIRFETSHPKRLSLWSNSFSRILTS